MARENQTGVFEIPQDPKLADLFRASLRNLKVQIRTHTVGTVTAYDTATQRADVSVDVLQVVRDNFTQPTSANPNRGRGRPISLSHSPPGTREKFTFKTETSASGSNSATPSIPCRL